jgi:hypothetical protein
MTDREKELMTDPAEHQTFVDPAEPKATTAFPTIAIVVVVLAIIIVAIILVLYR